MPPKSNWVVARPLSCLRTARWSDSQHPIPMLKMAMVVANGYNAEAARRTDMEILAQLHFLFFLTRNPFKLMRIFLQQCRNQMPVGNFPGA